MATLSGDKTYVTVVKGDTLSQIALTYKDHISGSTNQDRINTLVKLNNISDPDFIVIGQKIKLSGTASTSAKNNSNKVNVKLFGLQSNTDRTLYITWDWDWDQSGTDHYLVRWFYATGDGVSFHGSDADVKFKQATYNAPSNATKVSVQIKPIAKTTKNSNGKETTPWTAEWSTSKTYNFSSSPPKEPSAPNVTIDKYKLTASLTDIDMTEINSPLYIQFQVVKNDSSLFLSARTVKITNDQAEFSCNVDPGAKYKVRCRAVGKGNNNVSDWSSYSENVETIPATPASITKCEAKSKTSVYLEWSSSKTAKTYDIEYATKKDYFDYTDQTTVKSGIEFTKYELVGLEIGQEYFFRVRATNDKGSSAWSGIKSIVIGKDPAPPTTWSSTTTATVGDPLNLYWVHNTEDGSSQTFAEVEISVNGVIETVTVQNSTDEEEKDKTSKYSVDTSKYDEGAKILWRVRTAGITNILGEWSVKRTIDIYAPPTMDLRVTDSNGNDLETLTSFPFYIRALAGPNTQVPIGYHLTVTSNEAYETVDSMGNEVIVNIGDELYSRYFDTTGELLVVMSAGNIDLSNNIRYMVNCVASMDSGLTAGSNVGFNVAWEETTYEPNAEIGVDEETYTVTIMPYCKDEEGNLIEGVTLSVYRREFDGKFTELATGINNTDYTHVIDPHPSLDYARYRIVSTAVDTGATKYYDMPGYPVGGTSVIIQWAEEWSNYDTPEIESLAEPAWSGSMIKLPYNIDVTENTKKDVAHVEYIGREHPVTYFGTQLGVTQSWSTVIDKEDKETLYALRRLQNWMGNVYVREPSGIGFWASIEPSFSQKHRETTIPVTLDVTRVEGGI